MAIGVPGIAALTLGSILAWRYLFRRRRQNIRTSSASEVSGLPYAVWKALPDLFPEEFNGKDLSVFAFLYSSFFMRQTPIETSGTFRSSAGGMIRGVERAWFDCALCHTGTPRDSGRLLAHRPPMRFNNLDFHAFTAIVVAIQIIQPRSVFALIPNVHPTGTALTPALQLARDQIVNEHHAEPGDTEAGYQIRRLSNDGYCKSALLRPSAVWILYDTRIRELGCSTVAD